MNRALLRLSCTLCHFSNGVQVAGPPPNVTGDLSGVWGNLSGVWGDLSGVRGDLICCDITDLDRANGICIDALIEKGAN